MFGWFQKQIWWLFAGVSAAALIFLKGMSSGTNKAKQQELEAYKKTRQRMDKADEQNSPDAARDWLNDRMRNSDS
jgi:dipeptidase